MKDYRAGSQYLKKGIEYSGLFVNGNCMRITDGTEISINRTPFDKTHKDEIFAL